MQDKPKVSVIMPVYKGEKYLREAIDSILAQTFRDFELIIVFNADTNSNDNSIGIIKSYSDPRIRLIINKERGLSVARNVGLKNSQGIYIANLDCDDTSHPSRLQKQVQFLDANPDFGLIGSNVGIIDEKNKIKDGKWLFPAPAEEIPTILFFSNYFAQSATMIRKSALPPELYNINIPVAEDYYLWIRISEKNKLWNLPEILTSIRLHNANNGDLLKDLHPPTIKKIYNYQLSKLAFEYSEKELDEHYLFCVGKYESTLEYNQRLLKWFVKLNAANRITHSYEKKVFAKALIGRYYLLCRGANINIWRRCQIFLSGVKLLTHNFNYIEKAKIFFKSVLQYFR